MPTQWTDHCLPEYVSKTILNMIITFLGTSAANAFPEAFCKCINCEQARALGGSSLRKRSALLVNDDLLIDLGPDIMSASQMHGCSLVTVQYCLQTHPHADHLDLSHLLSRSPEYGVIGAPRLNFYASPETLERAAQTFERDLSGDRLLSPGTGRKLNLKIHPIEPLRPFIFGRYRVTAFPANHAPTMGAMLYALESDKRSIFYGTDTATLLEQTWQEFHQQKMHFNVVILDHTYGPDQPGSDHLSAHQVIEHVARMSNEGLLAPNARAFGTHIAHEGNPAHPELSNFAKKHGYEIAYDGLTLDV
jgi:phosphoribosyl 1,2-cyclic phosphate phosphodiesterase